MLAESRGAKIFPILLPMSINPALQDLLLQPQRVVIVTHYKPDADALGSSLGLAGFLRLLGHTVKVITPSDFPDFLAWMPGCSEVLAVSRHNAASQMEAEAHIRDATVIFCLDFSGLGRIDTLEQPVRQATAVKVMLDHHLEPEDFARFSYWDVTAASTAQLVLRLIDDMGAIDRVNADIASCLYAGLMTDTGGFRHNNTREEEFRIAARLVACGASPNDVARRIYDSSSLSRLRLVGHVLCNKLVVLPEFNTAYMSLTGSELASFQSRTGDTEGLVNYGLSVGGVTLSALFHERDGEIRISLRSVGDFSVNEMARSHFNGGGHRNAAGGSSKESLTDTINRFVGILPHYQEALKRS